MTTSTLYRAHTLQEVKDFYRGVPVTAGLYTVLVTMMLLAAIVQHNWIDVACALFVVGAMQRDARIFALETELADARSTVIRGLE